MSNKLKCQSLFSFKSGLFKSIFDKYEYPWEIIPYIKTLSELEIEGYTEIKNGVFAGDGVVIDESARVDGPAIIGAGTEIRHGAYIRGAVIIGSGCVIGNSSELKNCIIMDRCQIPHFNYVGDSVLGNGVHLGAGAICSNLRSDKSSVTVVVEGKKIDTGLRKLGAILGDGVEIGCGTVLCPGAVIGKNTSVYPLTLIRGTYPCASIVKNDGTVASK